MALRLLLAQALARMRTPDWWAFLLLAGAAYRTWRLLAEDGILDRPRRRALRLGSEWREEGDEVPEGYRARWGEFLRCSWCSGSWVALAWWGAWMMTEWTAAAAAPLALSAAVGIVRARLDPPE